jgi:hypothetical protein
LSGSQFKPPALPEVHDFSAIVGTPGCVLKHTSLADLGQAVESRILPTSVSARFESEPFLNL